MIQMTKLQVCLLIVICTIEFIDASCLSYGHSCWGAHGKRSYIPQREQNQETKIGEPNDRWGFFKIVPEKNNAYLLKGLFKGNQQIEYPENPTNSLNFPPIEQQISSSEEISPSSSIERFPQESEGFPQKQATLRQRFQLLRLNKPNYEQ